jgi:hypothetical protein
LRVKIRRAARLRAEGHTLAEVAAELRCTERSIFTAKKRYPKLWAADYRARIAEIEAAEAGKPDVDKPDSRPFRIDNPDIRDLPADAKARMPLLEFLSSVYMPTHMDLRDNTVEQYEISIRRFSEWLGRDACVGDLTEDNVRQFLFAYRESGISARTMNNKRRDLLAMWRAACDEDFPLPEPRSRRIGRAKELPSIPEAWNLDEVGRILERARRETGRIGETGIDPGQWWFSLLLAWIPTLAF